MAGLIPIVNIEQSTVLDLTFQGSQWLCVARRSGGATHVYIFYIATDNDLVYKKSTDNGVTWGSEIQIEGTKNYVSCSVWFDQWTPTDTTGTIVHIVAVDTATPQVVYHRFDLATDATAGNNDTVIDSPTTITTSGGGGQPCIIKTPNGNLWVSFQGTSPLGWHFLESTNAQAGGTWTARHDDTTTDMRTVIDDDADQPRIIPLTTGNDVLVVWHDADGGGNNGRLVYRVYDSGAPAFDTSSTILMEEMDLVAEANRLQYFCLALNKSTDDIYMYMHPSQSTSGSVFIKYDEGLRVVTKSRQLKAGGSEIDQYESNGAGITVDQTNGTIIVYTLFGQSLGSTIPSCFVTDDEGDTWSDMYKLSGYQSDDNRTVYCPPVQIDVAENWPVVFGSDDLNDLFTFKLGHVPYKRLSGTVKDDGGTAVVGAHVSIMRDTPHYSWNQGMNNRPLVGRGITDGSGNYDLHVIDPNPYKTNSSKYTCSFVSYGADSASTYDVDLSADPFTKTDSGKVIVDTTNEWVDIEAIRDTSNDSASIDLAVTGKLGDGTNLSDTAWTMRFKMEVLYMGTASSSDTPFFFGVAAGDNTTTHATSQDRVGIHININVISDGDQQGLFVSDGATIPLDKTDDVLAFRYPRGGVQYMELERSSDDFTIRCYYDSDYRELTESTKQTHTGITGLQYLLYQNYASGNVVNVTKMRISGIRFWNGTVVDKNTADEATDLSFQEDED